jgi:hypothetical protein
MEPTEDITGDVDSFAIPEEEPRTPDPDKRRKSILVQVSKELQHDIDTHNSFDSLQLPANATPEQKVALYDEIAIHKGLALHLKKYKSLIDGKLKEIK